MNETSEIFTLMNMLMEFGPSIVAIVISICFTIYHTKKQNKMSYEKNLKGEQVALFKTLMEVRYLPVSHEKTKALNLIELVFFNAEEVKKAWEKLYEAYAVSSKGKDEVEMVAINNNIDDKEIALLEEMAIFLGYKNIKWHSIKNKYTPSAITKDRAKETEYKEKQSEIILMDYEIKKRLYKEVVENNSFEAETKLRRYKLIEASEQFNETHNEDGIKKSEENVGE